MKYMREIRDRPEEEREMEKKMEQAVDRLALKCLLVFWVAFIVILLHFIGFF